MTSAKGLLLSAVARFALHETRVADVVPLAPRLRRVRLEGAALRAQAWTPGDKIQVLLPSRDVRTYTPLSWDAAAGATELVVLDHGETPGAVWGRGLRTGDTCRFVGPQRSLARRAGRAAILFGDETSLAVAHALRRADRTHPVTVVLEATDLAALSPALTALELADATVVARQAHDTHLGDAAAQIQTAARAHPGAELLFTGRARSIQRVRDALRSAGLRDRGASKAYWADGKSGLD